MQTSSNIEADSLDNEQKPLTGQDIINILSLTIKEDEDNKLATFLCYLTAYTEKAQFNISFNAPSSTGKSYIPMEVAKLFPADDVLEIGYCSPTAFFHDRATEYRKDTNELVVDLSHKIIIFLDQPHTQLLERMRPVLSHDKKEIKVKITDKNQKYGTKTKNVLLRGYPSVVFCTAGLNIDEQEASRFLLLSPEMNQKKIKQAIQQTIKKETNSDLYKKELESNVARNLLKKRLSAIKEKKIADVKIGNQQLIEKQFLASNKQLKPRHQRDVKRLVSLIKAFALLNYQWREKEGNKIIATQDDIDEALKLWNELYISQEFNIPPYLYNFYYEIILPAWHDKQKIAGQSTIPVKIIGLTRKEVLKKHYEIYKRILDTNQLRKQILPMLESTGLIMQEYNPDNKRETLVVPMWR